MKQGGVKRVKQKQSHVVKTGYLLLFLPFTLFLSVYSLRQNNLEMVELRNIVIAADRTGKGLEGALVALNAHIFRHMNTTTVRPVELVYTYNRQAQAAIQLASGTKSSNTYQKAAAACEQRGIPLTSIAECAAEYALSHSKNSTPQKVALPDKSRFVYSFVSPRWTPDRAGWSILITGVIIVWLLVRLLEFILVRFAVRRQLRKPF